MTGAENLDLSAIVVNWNTAALLDECLTSLSDYIPPSISWETIVFDNGSTDRSVELVRSRWQGTILMQSPINLGYPRASNLAIEASRGRYLLLINADARLTPGCIEALVDTLELDPEAAAVGPRLIYSDGTWQRWTAGCDPSLISAASYLLGLERLGPKWADKSVYLGRDITQQTLRDWVSSACMLVRRQALEEVGLLSERYFCYMDDVDLCRRFRAYGWSVWYQPEVSAVHVMGQSSILQTGAASPAALRNFNDYFTRSNGRVAGFILRCIELVGFAGRALLYLLMVRRPGARKQAKAHLQNLKVSLKGGHV